MIERAAIGLERASIIRKHAGVNAVYKQFRHKKERVFKELQYWRCVRRGCPGKIRTSKAFDPGDRIDVQHFVPHDHVEEDEADLTAHTEASFDACERIARNAMLTPLLLPQTISAQLQAALFVSRLYFVCSCLRPLQ